MKATTTKFHSQTYCLRKKYAACKVIKPFSGTTQFKANLHTTNANYSFKIINNGTKRPNDLSLYVPNLDGTKKLAECLADGTKTGDVLLLEGDVGCGKTAFSKFFLRKLLNEPNLRVTSPTFIIDNYYPYKGGVTVHHMDLYRINHEEELNVLELDDAFSNGISLIEWPDRLGTRNPKAFLRVSIRLGNNINHAKSSFDGTSKAKSASETLDKQSLAESSISGEFSEEQRIITLQAHGESWTERLWLLVEGNKA